MTMRYGAVLQSSCENRLVALQERRGREAAEALTDGSARSQARQFLDLFPPPSGTWYSYCLPVFATGARSGCVAGMIELLIRLIGSSMNSQCVRCAARLNTNTTPSVQARAAQEPPVASCGPASGQLGHMLHLRQIGQARAATLVLPLGRARLLLQLVRRRQGHLACSFLPAAPGRVGQ